MKTKGFTLVELLVVIAILAILATVSVVGYTQYIQNADAAVAKEDLVQARTAVMAADINDNSFTLGTTSLTWTVAATTEAAAKTAVETALKTTTQLPGTFTVTVASSTPDNATNPTKYTVVVSVVTYKTGNGTANWTIEGNKIQ